MSKKAFKIKKSELGKQFFVIDDKENIYYVFYNGENTKKIINKVKKLESEKDENMKVLNSKRKQNN